MGFDFEPICPLHHKPLILIGFDLESGKLQYVCIECKMTTWVKTEVLAE